MILVTACGGQLVDESDGGSGNADGNGASTGSSGGGSSGVTFVPCPPTAPSVGSPCSTPDHGCAFIDGNTGSCQAFVCGAGPNPMWASSAEGC